MAEPNDGPRSSSGLKLIETAAAVVVAAVTVALAWGLPTRLLVGGVSIGIAGGLGVAWGYARSKDRHVACQFAALGFPGLPMGTCIVVSFCLLILPLGLPSSQGSLTVQGSMPTTAPSITQSPTVASSATPTVPSTGTPNTATAQLTNGVTVTASEIDKNSSPVRVVLTVKNDSRDTFRLRLDQNDLSVTDDVHSQYSVDAQNANGDYCYGYYCNRAINSGVPTTIVILIHSKLSPNATVLTIKFTKISDARNVLIQASIPR